MFCIVSGFGYDILLRVVQAYRLEKKGASVYGTHEAGIILSYIYWLVFFFESVENRLNKTLGKTLTAKLFYLNISNN